MSAPWKGCAVDGRESGEMPNKPVNRERLLEEALEALTKALTECGAPWAVIGGIAVIARGVRRFTTDIDAAVRGDVVTVDSLLPLLAKFSILPRIADAVAFAEANLVLLLRHQPTGVDLDVSFAWSAFEHVALATSTMASFGRCKPRCAHPKAVTSTIPRRRTIATQDQTRPASRRCARWVRRCGSRRNPSLPCRRRSS